MSAVAAQFVGAKTQPAPPTSTAIEPGGYSEQGQASFAVKFFVPAGAARLTNFTVETVQIVCAGGGGYYASLKFLTIEIKRGGSFTAKGSQVGVLGGARATSNYSVTGRFQGKSATGAATATGVYRVDVVFADTPGRKCTSNDHSWTATRSTPPKKSVEPGTYSEQGQASYAVTFLVPAGAGRVLNFSTQTVQIVCAGGGGYYASLKFLTMAIKPDRSFTAKASQNGVVGGANAKLTYSVTGFFQGADAAGAATAAGVYRVDVVFTDTPDRRCTSNDHSWTAIRIR